MITLRYQPRQVLIDIDTQRDLLVANGVASVYNHRKILANIHRVMAAARYNHIPTISTAQIYDPDYHSPGYCLAGTDGFKKLKCTIRDKCLCYPTSDSTDLPPNLLDRYNQVVFCKRCEDPFEEPRLDRILTELEADVLYLIGATVEGSVKATAMGLLARGKRVTVLTDVVGTRNRPAASRAFREMAAKGAILSKATEILGSSALKIIHACPCKRCRMTG
ncbi:MAG: cysteine hydrolase family protein [Planctomycetota bacterium]|jgi:nicotinamidase-related amidase